MAWTRVRGNDAVSRGIMTRSVGNSGDVRGRAVLLACFLRILRVASAFAYWNLRFISEYDILKKRR